MTSVQLVRGIVNYRLNMIIVMLLIMSVTRMVAGAQLMISGAAQSLFVFVEVQVSVVVLVGDQQEIVDNVCKN